MLKMPNKTAKPLKVPKDSDEKHLRIYDKNWIVAIDEKILICNKAHSKALRCDELAKKELENYIKAKDPVQKEKFRISYVARDQEARKAHTAAAQAASDLVNAHALIIGCD